jgi:hypothetical protein
MKCNKTQSKWCINKLGALKIIDTFETYQEPLDHFYHNKHAHKHFNIRKLSKTMKHEKYTRNSVKGNR